ncbi:PREDICTED: rhodanese-like/PpiC domain-containing protein 12, chloroplastic isoform X1 [Theobroma cacao]|uniref:Rhodanese-like/PpiC domain-containing protein 12, chloroplastic isoform X1 n=1 Tax=Theobroma cacao TaxID=3641 RepID=A0AB32US02_THECC|nr:PREDICTED: rhodanese-like/PpiC domain-containing protein 12, chloroplastic isoform X1 [Theobroma cacao]
MLRATHLPPVASPTFFALRQSSIPALSVSSLACYSLHRLSTFSPFHSFFSKPLKPTRPYLPPLTLRQVSPMVGHPRLRPSASFNSESGSGDSREILVQHLLLKEDDQKLLLELQQKIAGGEDLSDLAVEYSICPSTENGGMLGWVRKGQMVPEFEEAAFSAPLNKVVKCKTNYGWHLLQVLSEREESLLKDIQPEEFHAKMQDPSFIEEAQLIDVREPEEVSQASLPGFQVLPLRQFGSWGPEITSKLDPMKDTYVMCHHGMRSLQVAKWLQTQVKCIIITFSLLLYLSFTALVCVPLAFTFSFRGLIMTHSSLCLPHSLFRKTSGQGFRKVFNLSGGIHAYATKVDPSVPTY